MSQSSDRCSDLLMQKLASLKKILDLSRAARFDDKTDVEDMAERFASLYARRENIIKQIMKTDEELSSPEFEGFSTSETYGEIISQIKDVALQIMVLDDQYSKIAEEVSKELKEGIRKARQGTNIYSAYTDEPAGNRGYSFDTKN